MCQLLHHTNHVLDRCTAIIVFVENIHVLLIHFRAFLEPRLHVDKLFEALEACPASRKVAIEDVITDVVLVFLNQELETDSIDELLELIPRQLALLITIELLKHRLELLVHLRVNQTARDVY